MGEGFDTMGTLTYTTITPKCEGGRTRRHFQWLREMRKGFGIIGTSQAIPDTNVE